jgi:energy-converting hydrogenase Eha subunit H
MTKLIAVGAVVGVVLSLSACSVPLDAAHSTVLNAPNSALEVTVQSDLTNAKLALVTYLSTTGSMPRSGSDLNSYGYVQSAGVSALTIVGSNTTDYCLSAASASGHTYHVTATSAPVEGGC